MSYAVGIDIGGTHIRLAIVSKTGKIEQVIKEKIVCLRKSFLYIIN